ncbi:MAG TPA: RNA polymerase sigma factor [Candidatus Sulfotelmatobacter sp.]|nr:RNA polymerase sigma factor [Candidatus Sulfotelmatobacter sp.]
MEAQQPARIPDETEVIQGSEMAADRRLVSGVLSKDRKATAEFVGHLADWIYPFVRRRLMPRGELVEDLMQEIVLAAWQALPTFRATATLRSWVMGIARHKLEDYYRKKIGEVKMSEEDDDALPEQVTTPAFEQQLDLRAQQKKVQRTLAMLPEAYALALIWQYRDEKSVREMAQLIGKSEKAMERLLARARQSFRRRWSDGQV